MFGRISYVVLLVVLILTVALPVAASEADSVNLPGWLGGLLAILSLLLPLLVWTRMRSRGHL